MHVSQQKQNLRKYFKDKRAKLTLKEVEEKSKEINLNFINNFLDKIYQKDEGKTFSLYLSSYKEVSTEIIAQYFKKNRINFSYPKIIQKNHALNFILFQENQVFKPNIFFPKILEPEKGVEAFPDLIILPLLAFDQNFSRLGMGGGFFDRTIKLLKKRNSKIIVVGLGYDFQRSDNILPVDDNDQKLDFIVTEKSIFSST